MKKIVIYAGFSSDNQREESINAQIRAITDYCNTNNYQIVKTSTGYDVTQDKSYVINEFEAETIRIIFDMAYKDMSYPVIIDRLEKEGRKSKLGKALWKTSLNSILRKILFLHHW